MGEEILINVTPHETRVAVVENGILHEVYIERTRKRGLVGNIYKGRVSRVLPGMQAAFIDIGLERNGFLHASDIVKTFEELEADDMACEATETNISALVSTGQEIPVQVIKDPLGSKGARLTTRISLPSRYLVFIPEQNTLGISQNIEDENERKRLREIILDHQRSLRQPAAAEGDHVVLQETDAATDTLDNGGFIVRTAAEGVLKADLHKDMAFLYRLWESSDEQIKSAGAPAIVYEDLPLVLRTMRDFVHTDIEKIKIDSRETFARVTGFAGKFVPELLERIEYYSGGRPILDLYSVEDEIHKSLSRKVQLKSGGHLVMDQTEAMTTIDVNTGAFVGHRNPKETIYKTNLEAAQTIARQLRLRNLGGIIIIDFIDMQEAEHRRQVLRALEKHLERDHAKPLMSELTSLGLVQLTRKRTRESLEYILCETCSTCHGRGTIKTVETVCYEIFREILREVRQFDAEKLLVVAAQSVVDMLLDEESTSVAELEEFIGRPISFQTEPIYSQEQYDIVLL